jgi:hypothetical protein
MHEDHDSALDDSRTEQLARDLDEQVRRLNHATADPSGLNHPGTAYSVLGSLSAVARRLDQTIAQLNAFLRREEKAGRLGHDQGQPTASACDAFGRALSAARVHADHLSASIADAQSAVAAR